MTTIEEVRRRAEANAKAHNYFLCPDPEMLGYLLQGLTENEERYGYQSCPCRLATGNFALDRDILCPCDYWEADIEEFGQCYCSLYVREDVARGKKSIESIPERRPIEKQERAFQGEAEIPEAAVEKPKEVVKVTKTDSNLKFWYCRQCGYVAFREEPPYKCPICGAKRDMFTEISFSVNIKER